MTGHMKRSNSLKLVAVLLVLSLLLAACAKDTGGEAANPEAANPMNYLKPEALKEAIESGSNDYVILDMRKSADFNDSHIVGSYSADQDKAKDGDKADGIANLKAALKEASGSETGDEGDKYVLICYSGKIYAQTGTDLLIEIGVKPEQIFTLEGGFKAWEAAGDEYKSLLE